MFHRFDLDNVTECDDEYWENTGLSEPFTQPVGRVSLVSFYTKYLKLMEIAASVQKSIVSGSLSAVKFYS